MNPLAHWCAIYHWVWKHSLNNRQQQTDRLNVAHLHTFNTALNCPPYYVWVLLCHSLSGTAIFPWTITKPSSCFMGHL